MLDILSLWWRWSASIKEEKRQQNEEFCDERKRFMWSCKAIDLMDCKSFDRKIGSWKELLWWSVESGEKLLSLSLRLISPKMFSQFSLNFKKFSKISVLSFSCYHTRISFPSTPKRHISLHENFLLTSSSLLTTILFSDSEIDVQFNVGSEREIKFMCSMCFELLLLSI